MEEDNMESAMLYVGEQLDSLKKALLKYFPDEEFILVAWAKDKEKLQACTHSYKVNTEQAMADAIYMWSTTLSDSFSGVACDRDDESTSDLDDTSDSS